MFLFNRNIRLYICQRWIYICCIMKHAYWFIFWEKSLNSFEENSMLFSWNVSSICVLLSYYTNSIIKLFDFCSSSYYKVLIWVSDGIFPFENISDENASDLILMALFAFSILMTIFCVIQGNNYYINTKTPIDSFRGIRLLGI